MNRFLIILCAAVLVAGGVVITAILLCLPYFRNPDKPQPDGPNVNGGPVQSEPLPKTAFEMRNYLPGKEETEKFDKYTKESVEFLREILKYRENDPWPTRVVAENDVVKGDKRTVMIRLEKVLKIEALGLEDGVVAVTVSDKSGAKPAPWRLGKPTADGGFQAFKTPDEVRAAFASLKTVAAVHPLDPNDKPTQRVVKGDDGPKTETATFLHNLGLEFEPIGAGTTDLPDNSEGAICFEAVIRSGTNRIDMSKAGGKWKIVRIEPVP